MPTHILMHQPTQYATLLEADNTAVSVLFCHRHVLMPCEISSPFSVLLNRRTRVMPPVRYLLQMKHIIYVYIMAFLLGYGLDDREIVVRLPTGEREFSVLHNIWGPSTLFNICNGLLPTG